MVDRLVHSFPTENFGSAYSAISNKFPETVLGGHIYEVIDDNGIGNNFVFEDKNGHRTELEVREQVQADKSETGHSYTHVSMPDGRSVFLQDTQLSEEFFADRNRSDFTTSMPFVQFEQNISYAMSIPNGGIYYSSSHTEVEDYYRFRYAQKAGLIEKGVAYDSDKSFSDHYDAMYSKDLPQMDLYKRDHTPPPMDYDYYNPQPITYDTHSLSGTNAIFTTAQYDTNLAEESYGSQNRATTTVFDDIPSTWGLKMGSGDQAIVKDFDNGDIITVDQYGTGGKLVIGLGHNDKVSGIETFDDGRQAVRITNYDGESRMLFIAGDIEASDILFADNKNIVQSNEKSHFYQGRTHRYGDVTVNDAITLADYSSQINSNGYDHRELDGNGIDPELEDISVASVFQSSARYQRYDISSNPRSEVTSLSSIQDNQFLTLGATYNGQDQRFILRSSALDNGQVINVNRTNDHGEIVLCHEDNEHITAIEQRGNSTEVCFTDNDGNIRNILIKGNISPDDILAVKDSEVAASIQERQYGQNYDINGVARLSEVEIPTKSFFDTLDPAEFGSDPFSPPEPSVPRSFGY